MHLDNLLKDIFAFLHHHSVGFGSDPVPFFLSCTINNSNYYLKPISPKILSVCHCISGAFIFLGFLKSFKALNSEQ